MIKFYLILVILIIWAIVLLQIFLRNLIQFFIILQGPFFAPCSNHRIRQIIKLAKLKPNMKIADLGSGDGRVLIELIKTNPRVIAVGYEIDPKYIHLSKKNIKHAGLDKMITIKNQSFWQADLTNYDLITLYCTQNFMKKLEKKLKSEIKTSARVISVYFKFPTWQPTQVLGEIKLYRK